LQGGKNYIFPLYLFKLIAEEIMKKVNYKELIESFFLGEATEEDQNVLHKWLLKDKRNVREYIDEITTLNAIKEEVSEVSEKKTCIPDCIKFHDTMEEMTIEQMEYINAAGNTEGNVEPLEDDDDKEKE